MQSELTYAIVPAGPGDAAELARVHVQSWRESYDGLLPPAYLASMSEAIQARRWRVRLMRAQEVTLAAETQSGLVAYGSGERARRGLAGEAEVTTLYVLKSAQRNGVGRRLLQGVARVLASREASSLIIWVLRDNAGARGFYEAMGGTLEAEREEPFGGGVVTTVAYRWTDIQVLTR